MPYDVCRNLSYDLFCEAISSGWLFFVFVGLMFVFAVVAVIVILAVYLRVIVVLTAAAALHRLVRPSIHTFGSRSSLHR